MTPHPAFPPAPVSIHHTNMNLCRLAFTHRRRFALPKGRRLPPPAPRSYPRAKVNYADIFLDQEPWNNRPSGHTQMRWSDSGTKSISGEWAKLWGGVMDAPPPPFHYYVPPEQFIPHNPTPAP